jgi:hypothetical protein
MKTVMLSAKALQAVAFAASDEESRYYLRGVLVEASASTVTYTATNGHILLATQHPVEPLDKGIEPLTGSWIIPLDAIQDKRLKGRDLVAFEFVDVGGGMALLLAGQLVTPIDGTFPDWRRVIPDKVNGKVAQFNPALLVRLQKAGDLFNDYRPRRNEAYKANMQLWHNGDSPAFVTWPDSPLFGVAMPHRGSSSPFQLPEWFVPIEKAKKAS